jgi:hypothetical protein
MFETGVQTMNRFMGGMWHDRNSRYQIGRPAGSLRDEILGTGDACKKRGEENLHGNHGAGCMSKGTSWLT